MTRLDDEPIEQIYTPVERIGSIGCAAGRLASMALSYGIHRMVATYDNHREALGQSRMLPPEVHNNQHPEN